MILIKNGKILTMAGKDYEMGSVLIDNGKIIAVGKSVEAPEDALVMDAEGKIVMPGMIDAHCHLGMWEDSIGFEGADGNEMTDPVTPQLRAIDGINPMDRTFEEAREGGITTVCTGPGSANVIGGTFAIIKTYGKRIDDMIVKEPAAMKVAFGENPKRVYSERKQSPSTRMATAAILREQLMKAKAYKEKLEKAKEDTDKKPEPDVKMEALQKVINKEIPLKAHAHRADDIFTAIRIAKEFDVDITLDHCTEGHLIADELAREGKYVISGPHLTERSKHELKNKSFESPVALWKAGVKFCIMTDHPVIPIQHLPICAGFVAKEGLDEMEALKAITIYPAEILGIADRVGSIEVGKDADIAIFDGHPFNATAKTEAVLIDGQVVYRR
ncbi:amidohydrolase [Lutispora saccharofermentans]|uniref:Amidohydrolase n=2 Tax=root TaxID=1 RepID=A0ABT1NDD4_9FIRM|nr:amidohydrolase [Lutispora saccharofermentans]MCQ1528649.1 amidohydrolase [Lutispora saccharofermentans]